MQVLYISRSTKRKYGSDSLNSLLSRPRIRRLVINLIICDTFLRSCTTFSIRMIIMIEEVLKDRTTFVADHLRSGTPNPYFGKLYVQSRVLLNYRCSLIARDSDILQLRTFTSTEVRQQNSWLYSM